MIEPERLIPWHVIGSSYPDEDPWEILDNRNLDNAIDEDEEDDYWDDDDDLD